jgi:SAM-dependent methyltransferase
MNRNTLNYYIGAILARMFPSKLEMARRSFTLPRLGNRDGYGRIERLIRDYVGEKASRHPAELEALHKEFWRGRRAQGWYGATADRFEAHNLPLFSDRVERCIPAIGERNIARVREFGCGDGQWLNYLSERWTGPTDFLGIDLAKEQIERNQRRYPQLRFECADLTARVREHAMPDTIFVFVTQGGVLEYLSQQSLCGVFETIVGRARDALLFLIEPLADNFDLSTQCDSLPYGGELSYSHNYPALMQAAGISIVFQDERRRLKHRMRGLLARTP